MYSLPTLSSLCPKLKKGMKRFPTRSLTYWGILAVEATNKNIIQKMTFNYKDWYEMLLLPRMDIVLQYTFQTGATPPPSPIYNMEIVLPVEVEVPLIGVLLKSKLDRI
jgi:hypothetical protein